jgi:outer membrane protein assembly factor BamB
VSAEDGNILWKNTEWKMRTNAPTPVVVGPDRIFLTAGYGQYDLGCMMIRLVAEGDKITAKKEFLHPTEVFGSMQQTPVLYKGHIYGVGMDKQLACLDLEGNVLWRSSSANKFGHGPYMIADGMIYIMDDDGLLRIVAPSASGYKELDQAKVLDGHESWGPMAVAGGRIILRDLTRMVCLEVKAP